MKFFTKTLTKTDVGKRLALSSKALQHLPGFVGDQRAQPLTVEDEEGNTCDFLFRIRKGKYKKPEISTGWLKFVRRKKLKTGDEIHFFKEEDEATGVVRYMIKVITKVRLLGAVIGYVPNADQADR